LNNVRPTQRRSLRDAQRVVGADCDVSIDAKSITKKLKSVPAEFRSRSKVALFAGTNGIMLEFIRSGKRKRYQCRVDGSWKRNRRIEVPARSLLDNIESADEPRLRLTYIAGRLFVNRATIAATDKSK